MVQTLTQSGLMQEIQEQFGSPSDYDKDDFVNMTDWVRHGTNLQ